MTYVECHGTGTKLGDPIEIAALTETFRTFTDEKQSARSVLRKPMLVMLGSLRHHRADQSLALPEQKQIPASLHFHKPNPHIAFDDSPFYMKTENAYSGRCKAAQTRSHQLFGISGTNSHVVMEEFISPTEGR